MHRKQIALVLLLVVTTLGCPRKKTDDQSTAASAAASATPPAAEAANDADIKRYSDERAIDHEGAVINVASTKALRSVPKGDAVATLKKGTAVKQLAEHNGYYRVTFDDPKDGSNSLMGWVVKFAFDEAPPPAKRRPVPKCPDSSPMLVSDKQHPITARCSLLCTEDSDCPSGSCEAALILNEKGDPDMNNGDMHWMSACTAGRKGGGAAPADAGKAAPAARSVPTCKDGETLVSEDEHAKPFCALVSCTDDAECHGAGKCVSAFVTLDDGSFSLNAHGNPIGGTFCKPR